MKKTEVTLVIIIFVGLILKFLHLPGGSILTVLSFSLLATVYLYIGFAIFNNLSFKQIIKKETYKKISKKRIRGGVLTSLALSIGLMGLLLQLMSWPGAKTPLLAGIIGLGIATIIALVKIKNSSDNFYSNILKRTVFLGVICTFTLLIPNKTWLTWKFPNHPEYVNTILDAQANPNNQELQEKMKEEREKIFNK